MPWFVLPPLGSSNKDLEFQTLTQTDKFRVLNGGDEWGNDGGARMVRRCRVLLRWDDGCVGSGETMGVMGGCGGGLGKWSWRLE
ncbi:hypothetical protein Goklo_029430, partial [Gossypium klotzschianum]|nr:hypothetical protein [Gossypium klotzschianum]